MSITPPSPCVSFIRLSAAAILLVTSASWAQEWTPPTQKMAEQAQSAANKYAKSPNFSAKDPFSADKWHAASPSWPGTLVFDSKTKKVTLNPMGAKPIEANYAYTVKSNPVSAKKEIFGDMTFSSGEQKSAMTFKIKEGKDLVLTFSQGQREEVYRRMSKEEVSAYEAKLKEMWTMPASGGVKPVAPIP